MSRFTVPKWVKKHNLEFEGLDSIPSDLLDKIKNGLKKFHVENPEISIVIPAYNEEKNIIKTLSSLSEIRSNYRIELIVSNNNSKDRTQEILDRLGVKSILAYNQGISHARQTGLEAARGKFIANADADSIYPPTWVDTLIEPLKNNEISCSYGTYSFIPGENTSRAFLGAYELAAESFFKLKKKNRECVSVMGFNFAFRKQDAMEVGGFNHTLERKITQRSEDGWMALCLMQKGKLQHVTANGARMWTSDRRLMDDGSLGKAFLRRAKKELSRLSLYLTPKGAVKVGNTQ